MDKQKILLETYDRYIEKVNKSIKQNDTMGAKTYLELATVKMYELALIGPKELKEARTKRADILFNQLVEMDKIIKQNSNSVANVSGLSKSISPEDYILKNGASNSEEVIPRGQFTSKGVPSVSFDDVAGLEDVKEAVREKVLLPLKYPEDYDGYDIKLGGGIFLYGPPGTGKTMIAAAIAHEIDAEFISIKGSDLFNKYQGETEKRIKALFAEARSHKRTLIFFDEMDSLTPKNTRHTGTRQARAELLSQIQGIESYYKNDDSTNEMLLIVGATNKPWDIDSAFLRDGRFGDRRIYVGLPDNEARRYILTKKFEKLDLTKVALSDDINIDKIVEMTNGYNGANMNTLFDQAQQASAKRAHETKEKIITMDDFISAKKQVQSSVHKEDLEKLRRWTTEK
jgi:SpoVK/Ycf46/Vps4 family AAA+-type ATPase